MEKQVKMTIEQAKDLFKSNPEFRNTILSVFTDDELGIDNFPKTFESLKVINGCYMDSMAHIEFMENLNCYWGNKNVFPTEKHAKSALAFAQLSQLAARVNGDWIPDWDDMCENKYVVQHVGGLLKVQYYGTLVHHIVFKTKELAEKSLQYHRQLWLDYYMID